MKNHLKALGRWALARSQERTTYVGLAMVAAAVFGHHLSDQYVNALAFAGQLIGAGLIAVTEERS